MTDGFFSSNILMSQDITIEGNTFLNRTLFKNLEDSNQFSLAYPYIFIIQQIKINGNYFSSDIPAVLNFNGFSNLKSNVLKISEVYLNSLNNLDISYSPSMFSVGSASAFYANRFQISNTV